MSFNQFIFTLLTDILAGKVKPMVTYEDPDLTPIKRESRENRILRVEWLLNMDYKPLDPRCSHLSSWLMAIYKGDYPNFLVHLAG